VRGALRALGCVFGLAVAPAAFAGDLAEQELEALQQAIEQRRLRIETFEREHEGLLAAIEAIDQAVAAHEDVAAARAREAADAERRLRELEVALPDLEARLARTRQAMSARVVALYKTGTLGPAELVFASQSLRQLLERVDALGKLLAHDRLLVARFRAEEHALGEARRGAAEAGAQRDEAQAQLARRRAELAAERSAKQRLLAAVHGDRARESAALEELEAAARALEAKIAALGDEDVPAPVAPAVPFASLRGTLPAPVDAAIVRRFGREIDAQFRTQVFHKGVDFGAPLGAPVRAVAAGTVRFAGWFRGYGRMVIIDHGDRFFTVSGHLDTVRVEAGASVVPGEPIGTVGDTGSLSGPRLYFEIREGATAVDPKAWLAPRARASRGGAAPARRDRPGDPG
jgi:septal ring factor EnvC (AmiA/AmiB activator)